MSVVLMVIVWKYCGNFGCYSLGVVAPGNGAMSWRRVYITFRRQIGSLCRETWAIFKNWRDQEDPGWKPGQSYSDSYGLVNLNIPPTEPWLRKYFMECPNCGASWPMFRWVWAAEHLLFVSDDPGRVPERCVTFCSRECSSPFYCPTLHTMLHFLRDNEAPKKILGLYEQKTEDLCRWI